MFNNKWSGELPEYLYHATSVSNLESYLSDGIPKGSYWANDYVSEYYQEDFDGDGILLKIPLSVLKTMTLSPDQNGIDEPISTYIGLPEEDIQEIWIEGFSKELGYNTPENHKDYSGIDPTWANSLALIGSIKVDEAIILNDLIEIEYI